MASLHDIFRGDVIPLSGLAVSLGRNSFDPPSPSVPFYEFHDRLLVMHDSALANNNSGVLFFDARRNVMQLIPGNSGSQTITTAVCFEAYDSVGGSGIDNTLLTTTISFNTARINTHPSIFSFVTSQGKCELQINASGLYEFNYRVAVDNRTTTFQNVDCWVERRSAGGLFAEIPGTRTVLWVRNNGSTADNGACSACFLLDAVGVGDTFRVRGVLETAVAAGAEPIQLADYSNLVVRKLG